MPSRRGKPRRKKRVQVRALKKGWIPPCSSIENPELESISMEPSDGGGWCECDACDAMGSITDQVVILANAVAEAINALGLGDKYVGLLAYHLHSPPPSVRVHPRVIVRAATNAVRFGYTHQEISEGWSRMGATMGVFDLYSVHMWDQSQPARQKGSDIPAIVESLTRYHRTGARYMSLAHSDNFGPSGLGMYLAGRIRDTHMVHTRPIMDLAARNRVRGVTNPPPESVRDDTVYTASDIERFVAKGVDRYQPAEIDFDPVVFSRDLVPPTPLNPPDVEPGNFGGIPRGRQAYYTWLEEPGSVTFEVTGGFNVSYPHLVSNIRLDFYADRNPTGEAVDSTDHVEPDQTPHSVTLHSPYPGLHRVTIDPPANRAVSRPPDGMVWTMEVSQDEHNTLTGEWDLYFYVPRDTPVVGGFTDVSRGVMLDADGNQVYNFRELTTPAYFRVPVPEEQAGRFWKLAGGTSHSGRRILLTVPPLLARTPSELLLPREVVEKDREGNHTGR